MGNVLNLLLKVCVIFNIDAVGNYDICISLALSISFASTDIFISVQDSILTSDSRAFYADIFVCNVGADKLFRQSQLYALA